LQNKSRVEEETGEEEEEDGGGTKLTRYESIQQTQQAEEKWIRQLTMALAEKSLPVVAQDEALAEKSSQ
jgi:hypothetical protein